MDTYLRKRFFDAARFLPRSVRNDALAMSGSDQDECEEFRLRTGDVLSAVIGNTEKAVGENRLSSSDLNDVLERATSASVHAVHESMKNGYITAPGGHRIGVCGSAVVKEGEICGFKHISSLNIRIAKEIRGVSGSVVAKFKSGGLCRSILIIAPPGRGKTTFLRDYLRVASNDFVRCSLADERSEIAACVNGVPQLDVGSHTDVLDAAPKDKAVMLLLRAMNPQLIAMDEITAPEDAAAALKAAHCGVKLLATAHADSLSDLKSREVYRKLLEEQVFEEFILITGSGKNREYSLLNSVEAR